MTLAEYAAEYIAKMPRSISGSGGHTALFNVAAALMRGFGLTEDVALRLLTSWNQTHADPAWGERDLRAKLEEGANANREAGYLLRGFQARQRDLGSKDEDQKREARAKWPTFRPLSEESLQTLADLRRLPLAAIHVVNTAGFLAGAMVSGHRCFIVREGTFAQVRRLDGGTLTNGDGDALKAKNLPGSQGHFIGHRWLGDTGCPILLVEGAIALLEGTAAVLAADADVHGWVVVAATSATSRFDSTWLGRLKGRRIRIVPDGDQSGLEACGRWTASLRRAGCEVDAFRLPAGCKDLGPVVEDSGRHRPFLTELFTIPSHV